MDGRDLPLEKVFEEVKKQTGLLVAYKSNQVKDARPVTVRAKNLPVAEFLQQVLKDQPFTYTIEQNTIFIRKKKQLSGTDLSPRVYFDAPPTKGFIRSADGQPLSGVNIIVKGTSRGTTTDANGSFSIDAKVGDKLVISSIGYAAQEITVSNNNNNILISLVVSTSSLDEVQIIAYGTTSQRLSTANIGTIKSEDIARQPVSNPLAAMIGRIPGVFITQNTGVAGGGFNLEIRGKTSLENGNEPFYIIDGVPYMSQLLPNLADGILQTSNSRGGGGNPLSFISPSEIESISVLKDADATAIYGSRGANGVILITTKKGKAGKSKVGVNFSSGIGQVSHRMKLLNTSEYLEMRREAFLNDGIQPDASTATDLLTWDSGYFTNWQKEIIGATAKYTDVQASISGGNSISQYMIASNLHRETTVFPGDFANQKQGVNFSVKGNSSNQKLGILLSGYYLADVNKLPSYSPTGFIFLPPNAPKPFNEDGSLNWANSTWPNYSHPYATLQQVYNGRTNNLVGNLRLNYSILPGLDLSTNFGYNNMQVKENQKTPISSKDPLFAKTGSASFTSNSISSWIFEPQFNYKAMIGNGRIEVLAGATFQRNKTDGNIINVSGYSSDALLENMQAAPNRNIISVVYSDYKYNAVFSRLNYNLKDKYIVNLNIRRDGSSRFGSSNKFHNFGSFGAAWMFSQEKGIQHALPFLSFGKLRGSYGTTGSDQIPDYVAFDLFAFNGYPYQGISTIVPGSLYNPNIQWEETNKLEGGIELGFFKDKILLNLSYYYNRSSNQLITIPLSEVTGNPAIITNLPGVVENKGLEMSLSTVNIQSKTLSWTTSLNFTIPKNRLASFLISKTPLLRIDM